MERELVADIIQWDVKNWSKALAFWSENVDIKSDKLSCLELGARRGGLSLWLALNGNEVVCSDMVSPEPLASALHQKYSCTELITYRSIDATNIPFKNKFDIVIFKSILGGIASNGRDHLKKKVVEEIYDCLKPTGKLLFAENLDASFLHRYVRKRFVKWGKEWSYAKYNEIEPLFESFENIKYQTVGFLGLFGRTRKQRNFLAKIDAILSPFIPIRNRYIVFGVAEKGNKQV